jgi:hypothetical protein
MVQCPGQDLRFWKLGDIFDAKCPHCGTGIEFWKDEPSVKCPQCRRVIVNPKLDLGCAQWCQHAEQCLGASIDPQSILCKKLIKELKSVLGQDEQKINHSLAVFKNAQQILAGEQADARVVNAAAILHTLGGPCPAQERPTELSGVREILARCGVDAEQSERICQLIGNDGSGPVGDGTESKILWDAEQLVRLADLSTSAGPIEAKESVLRILQTQKGRELANVLIGSDEKPHEQAG